MEAREVRALARLGIADPYEGDRLMATQHDDEGGSRLWRGMRALIFGEDSEPTLRDQIEEAIDEAEDAAPKRGDLTPDSSGRCCATCCISATAPPARSRSPAATSSRCPSTISFDELVARLRRAEHSRLPVYWREPRRGRSA